MEGESGVIPNIINELQSSDIQRGQMEGECGVPRSIIDERPSSDPLIWKVKVVLVEVYLMIFILRIWPNGRTKWSYSKYH